MPCFRKETDSDTGSTLMEKKLVTNDLEAKLQRPSRPSLEANMYSAEEGESEKKKKVLIRDGERDKEGTRKGEGENKEVFIECKGDFLKSRLSSKTPNFLNQKHQDR